MARDPRHDVLFEPITLGPVVLKNRFYQVPQCSGFGVEKPSSQARHRAVKAEGGWGAVCTEYCSVSQDSDHSPWVAGNLWDENDVRALSIMCDEVHAHDALAGVELHHGGVQAGQNETRWPSLAPSQITGDFGSNTPKAMTHDDIRRVQADWVVAAKRAVSAGFDIVYVYAAHSYLPMQFLSPTYNRRTDEYGGSVENRARFFLETLTTVREAVGDLCAIAARISVDDLGGGGLTSEDSLAIIQMADPLVDLWDVNVGVLREWGKDAGTSRFFEEGHQLQWTRQVRSVTQKPIVGVSRFTSPDLMADVVRSGDLDIIGAARPSIADPFLPLKINQGKLEEIRECIGINYCISSARHRHLGCAQNATVGEEYRRGWHPERFDRAANRDKDVLIVGAGLAGLECAVVLGKRGMGNVHLVDAESEVGGSMRWLSQLPGLGQWRRMLNYREIQLKKLRAVSVILGERLDADAIRTYGAEIVVIATGANWATDGINGVTHEPLPGIDVGRADCLTPEQIMLERKRPSGRRVAIYDCDGYVVGTGLAELLRSEGYSVDLVTPHDRIARSTTDTLEAGLVRRRVHDLGIAAFAGIVATGFEDGTLVGRTEFDEPWSLETDGLVLVTQRISDDALWRELDSDRKALEAEGLEQLLRIGECVAPRSIADIVFDGHRLGREIDSPDPSLPLPYVRERALPTIGYERAAELATITGHRGAADD